MLLLAVDENTNIVIVWHQRSRSSLPAGDSSADSRRSRRVWLQFMSSDMRIDPSDIDDDYIHCRAFFFCLTAHVCYSICTYPTCCWDGVKTAQDHDDQAKSVLIRLQIAVAATSQYKNFANCHRFRTATHPSALITAIETSRWHTAPGIKISQGAWADS